MPAAANSVIQVGLPAPPLRLPEVEHGEPGARTIDLAEYRGGPVLVSFLSHAA